MTKPALDSLMWRRYRQYYQEVDGQIIWQSDTPREILQSYEYYCDQLEKLNNFVRPSKPSWRQWFLGQTKPSKIDERIGLAQRFLEKQWPDNARFIKAKRIDRQVIIFWAADLTHYISVIHFKDGYPSQESRYIKKQRI